MKYLLMLLLLVGCSSTEEVVKVNPVKVRQVNHHTAIAKKNIEYLRTGEKLEEYHFNPIESGNDSSLRFDSGYAHRVIQSPHWITDPRAPKVGHLKGPIQNDNWKFQYDQEKEAKLASLRSQEVDVFKRKLQIGLRENIVNSNVDLVKAYKSETQKLLAVIKAQKEQTKRMEEELKVARQQSMRLLEKMTEANDKKDRTRGYR
jgi:hypothetical protein